MVAHGVLSRSFPTDSAGGGGDEAVVSTDVLPVNDNGKLSPQIALATV